MLSEPDFIRKKVILVYSKDGDKISFKNDNIVITDKDGVIKCQLSCYLLFAIFVIGGISLTSGIISRSKKFGFSIILFSANFRVYSTINYSLEGNTLLRAKQYQTEKSLQIAKKIIINKLENQKFIIKKLRNKECIEGEKIRTNRQYYNY